MQRLRFPPKRLLFDCLAVAVLAGAAVTGFRIADRQYASRIADAALAAHAASYGIAASTDEALSLRIEKIDAQEVAASQAQEISSLQQTIDGAQKKVLDALT